MLKTYAHEHDIDDVRHPVPLVDPVNRMVLVTNGKCGGTSLKHLFFRNAGLDPVNLRAHDLISDFGPVFAGRYYRRAWKRRNLADRDPHLETRDLTAFYRRRYSAGSLRRALADGYAVVMVCRNPFDRAASAFDDKFCGADADKPFVRQVIEDAGSNGDITFAQFLTHLDNAPERSLNGHWRRQTFVVDGINVDHFIRLEHLHEDLAWVRHLFPAGETSGGVHLQRGANAEGPSPYPRDVAHVPAEQIRRIKRETGVSPPKSAYLTAQACEALRRVYAEDFRRLPYEVGPGL